MSNTARDQLSPDEVAQIRAMVEAKTPKGAAVELRLAEQTVIKAMAGLPVQRLTAIAIRSHIGKRQM
jgi:hypothetical protein